MIINAFKNGIFPFSQEKSEFKDEDKNDIGDKNDLFDCKKFDRLFNLKEGDINDDLIRKQFRAQNLSTLLKTLFKLRNKKKNNALTNAIKIGLRDLKKEIEEMSRNKIKM